GICASAATLLSLSCTRRYILPSSFMLIHQLSSFMWGTHEQFKDEMSLQAMMMERLIAFYTSKTKLSDKAVKDMLTRDSWMDAETCLKHEFVDEILR
ncbi:MAG: ATP-dependent Clp protease proteolytic subunit, partial [Anaerolineae bacterium]|nr:ATP-dependent Clp protease proteolytic subunit [Anaerolineae bacterium]